MGLSIEIEDFQVLKSKCLVFAKFSQTADSPLLPMHHLSFSDEGQLSSPPRPFPWWKNCQIQSSTPIKSKSAHLKWWAGKLPLLDKQTAACLFRKLQYVITLPPGLTTYTVLIIKLRLRRLHLRTAGDDLARQPEVTFTNGHQKWSATWSNGHSRATVTPATQRGPTGKTWSHTRFHTRCLF